MCVVGYRMTRQTLLGAGLHDLALGAHAHALFESVLALVLGDADANSCHKAADVLRCWTTELLVQLVTRLLQHAPQACQSPL
jgi:hypothetical protein